MATDSLSADAGVFDATTQRWLRRVALHPVLDLAPDPGDYMVDEEGLYRFSPFDAFHRMHVFDERRMLAGSMGVLGLP